MKNLFELLTLVTSSDDRIDILYIHLPTLHYAILYYTHFTYLLALKLEIFQMFINEGEQLQVIQSSNKCSYCAMLSNPHCIHSFSLIEALFHFL